MRQGLSEPEFYDDLVYKLKKIVGSHSFSAQFIKIISYYNKIGFNIDVLQQTACLVVIPITIGHFSFLFNCMSVGRTSFRLEDLSIGEMGRGRYFGCCQAHRCLPIGFLLLRYSVLFNVIYFLYLDLYVLGDDALI